MISAVVPVHNAAGALPQMLKSLRDQKEPDFEVILVDDGSVDGSGTLCDEAAGLDRRFFCIHQANAGVSAARNRGMQAARGEYLTFLDADDRVPENYFQSLLEACRGADCSVCDVAMLRGETETGRFTLAPQILTQVQALGFLLARRGINSGPCAKLFRRELLADLRFPPLKTYEDILFVKDAFLKSRRIAVTNKTVYYYLQNPQGAMGSMEAAPSLDVVRATGQLLEFIAARPELPAQCFYITASHLMQYAMPLALRGAPESGEFLRQTKAIYRGYWKEIARCSAFPWKEKLVFWSFGAGFAYSDRRLIRFGGQT